MHKGDNGIGLVESWRDDSLQDILLVRVLIRIGSMFFKTPSDTNTLINSSCGLQEVWKILMEESMIGIIFELALKNTE
jgi:hypothetical protein